MNADLVPTLRQSQLTWAVSRPVGCYRPHSLLPFVSIAQLYG